MNQPAELAKTLAALESIREKLNGSASGGQVSLADLAPGHLGGVCGGSGRQVDSAAVRFVRD